MTTRRQLLQLGLLGPLAPLLGYAQSRPVQVGMLSVRPLAESLFASAIVRRLAELGYREGKEMSFAFRTANGIASRYPELARELAAARCELIFAIAGESGIRALRTASPTVPIVLLAADFDPVEAKLVSSLRRPGNNITGVYLQSVLLGAKRLEILREILPAARRILVLSDEYSRDQLGLLRRIAEAGGLSLTVVDFPKQPYDFPAAFEIARTAKAEGMVMPASPVLSANRKKIAQLALEYRLPSVGTIGAAEAGFLATYSTDNLKAAARVAELGVQVLKGAIAGDTPMELASEFELVINAGTAKTLGLKIPESVMARTTRIVR